MGHRCPCLLPVVLPKTGIKGVSAPEELSKHGVRVSMECVAERGTISTATAPAARATTIQAFSSIVVENLALRGSLSAS